MKSPQLFLAGLAILSGAIKADAQVPAVLNYQGRVQVGTTDFNGAGLFKFSLVNADGTTTYWSNDGTPVGQPAAPVTLPVARGLYSVQLGDATLPNMTAVPTAAFANGDVHLRVWFNDGVNGFQQFVPDQRIGSSAFAVMAGNAQSAASVAPGAITSAMLADGAVTVDKLAPGSVTAAIAPGSISGTAVAEGAITPDKLGPLPASVGGTLTIVGTNSSSVTHNVTWVMSPAVARKIALDDSGHVRPIVSETSLLQWTVSRPLTPDYAWKEWVRETAMSVNTNFFRTVQIQFTGGPTLVMSNAFPTGYQVDVTKDGFKELLTVQPNTFEIQ